MDVFEKCFNCSRIERAKAGGYYPYYRKIQSGGDHQIVIDHTNMIMIGSLNYLGIAQDPRVKEAAIRAIERYGSSSSGSRLLNGTLDIHEELEYKMAKFMHKPACQVFTTGFDANQAIISSIIGRNDVIVIDRLDHASIIDGCRLSFGRTIKYDHNDMEDLEKVLASLKDPSCALIIVDGIFSMGGDMANLPEIVRLKNKYGCRLMVDDAHGIGTLGANGRGTAEHFGVEDDVDLIMGSFAKAVGSIGGFVVGPTPVVNHVRHHARALIFTVSSPPSVVAATLAALKIIDSEPWRRLRLWNISERMRNAYKTIGLNIGTSQSQVVPLIIGDDMTTAIFWHRLLDNHIYANTVVSPAVPPGKSLIRTSYMATHTDDELDRVIEVVSMLARDMGLVKQETRRDVREPALVGAKA